MSKVFGGIEGGGSRSTVVLYSDRGAVLVSKEGPGVNPWQIGFDECAKQIALMVQCAKADLLGDSAGETVIVALGLALSGVGSVKEASSLEKCLKQNYPDLAQGYYITNDAVGSLYTASADGGVVLIAGTGSNCIMVNPEGDSHNCGGWGHMLGDEGSAYWIAHRALKTVFDVEDNHSCPDVDVGLVKSIMLEHFKIANKREILPHMYTNFSKSAVARMCVALAKAAVDTGDSLCCSLFTDAGRALAAHITALLPKVSAAVPNQTLKVICVGSVWKSWPLLQAGFEEQLLKNPSDKVKCVQLLHVNQSSAIGAAYLGAKSAGLNFPMNYELNASIVCKLDV